MKYLLFPLGNPGKKYEETRHNAGRYVLEYLKKDLEFKNILEAYDFEIFIPDTFMNESGKALKYFLKNKNFDQKNIIIIYDDKDLPIGDVRLSINKNAGGHNGLKDIIEKLNTKEFYRIRIGIAPKGTGRDGLIPPHGDIVQKYVLGNMNDEEKSILKSKQILNRIKLFLKEIIKDNNQNI